MYYVLSGCQGVVQLGSPDPWYNWADPAKVVACDCFLFTESSLVGKKIKVLYLMSPSF